MRRIKLSTALGIAVVILLSIAGLLLVNSATAKVTLQLGWVTANSPADPYAITARYFAEELDKMAPAHFEVKFFPNHQLGNDAEMLQAIQLGTLEAGVINSTQVSAIAPAFKINDIPFLYRDSAHAQRVLDGEIGRSLFAQLAKRGIIGLGFAEGGFRHIINNVRPIDAPRDLQGLRLRVQSSDMFLTAFRMLGASPLPIPWSDTFAAVKQGAVDGLEVPLAVIYANKYPTITAYLSLTSHSYSALTLLISERAFKRLSKEDQVLVRHAAARAVQRQRQTVAASEAAILARLKAAGMRINSIEHMDAFRQRAAPVYVAYRQIIGADLLDKALHTGGSP